MSIKGLFIYAGLARLTRLILVTKIFTCPQQNVLHNFKSSFHLGYKVAITFNFSSPEFLSHSKLEKNQVSSL